MPRAKRRCAKVGCRAWQPCSLHQTSWAKGPNHRPLPRNWATLKKKVRERDGDVCEICGSCWDTEIDHRIPRSEDGPDALWNLRVLCHLCHVKVTKEAMRRYKGKGD